MSCAGDDRSAECLDLITRRLERRQAMQRCSLDDVVVKQEAMEEMTIQVCMGMYMIAFDVGVEFWGLCLVFMRMSVQRATHVCPCHVHMSSHPPTDARHLASRHPSQHGTRYQQQDTLHTRLASMELTCTST